MQRQNPMFIERGPNFDRAREQMSTPFAQLDIDLSTAGTNVVFRIAGDFIYFDPDPGGAMLAGGVSAAGFVAVELNNEVNAPVASFLAKPGWAINAVFTLVKLSWPAQPGLKARLMYSTGSRIAPTNSATVSGAVSITPQTMPFRRLTASNYKDTTALGAGASVAMLAPTANVNGAIVRAIMCNSQCPGSGLVTVLAKAGAPANNADGIVLACSAFTYAAAIAHTIQLTPDFYIAPGLGVYFFTQQAEAQAVHSLIYELL